ncbi:unnamed protein product [Lupinus luteus]|uniref:SCP domain-containing protein n=1 Tax=Lupinus luteus TaxID=3873 RepID=A0AAV1WFL6_LUPLU
MCCCISLARHFSRDFLIAHNKARAEVGVPPLRWNKALAVYAKIYAKSTIRECRMEHSNGPYDTVQVGCAKEKCSNGWMFAICSYNPQAIDIVTDFSDDEEIELCDDDDIETTEPEIN